VGEKKGIKPLCGLNFIMGRECGQSTGIVRTRPFSTYGVLCLLKCPTWNSDATYLSTHDFWIICMNIQSLYLLFSGDLKARTLDKSTLPLRWGLCCLRQDKIILFSSNVLQKLKTVLISLLGLSLVYFSLLNSFLFDNERYQDSECVPTKFLCWNPNL
jgi:hypothetical protein